MARRKKRKSADRAPGWAWMLVGLSIGLIVALVVWLQGGDATPGDVAPRTAAATAERPRATASTTGAASAANATNAASGGGNSQGTDADADADAEEEFSFFRLLPESEVVVPASGSAARSTAAPAQEYIIQAGSYSEYADADGVQARLALLGIESKVERAIVGNEIRYRVIIGPISGREEIANTVRRLNAARIESMPPRAVSN